MDSIYTLGYNGWAVSPPIAVVPRGTNFATEILTHLDHLYRSPFI